MSEQEICKYTIDMLGATREQRDNWSALRVAQRREERNARQRELRRTRREREFAKREAAKRQLKLTLS